MSLTPLSAVGLTHHTIYGNFCIAIIASTRNLRRFYENLQHLSVKIIALLHLQIYLLFAQRH